MGKANENGKANGTSSGDIKIVVEFPTADGRGIDRKALNKFLDEVESIFYELELQELKGLIAEIDKQWSKEPQWRWNINAAHHLLREVYAGRRFQIVGVEGDGLVLEIAVTAAAFGVLKEALDNAHITPRLDGARDGLLKRAERSHETTLIVLRDRFSKSDMFGVNLDEPGKRLVLTAKLEEQDRALPTMREFVETARGKGKGIWDSLVSLIPISL